MSHTSQLFALFVAIIALAISGCDNAQTDPSPSNLNASTEATTNAAAIDVDADLDAMARAMALSIGESPNLTGAVVNGVSERFNGDTEIMWKDISERQVDGASFSATMTSSFAQAENTSQTAAAATIDELAARNPRLHIAVRGDVEALSAGESSPLVAFAPESIDDLDLESVKAYDGNGNVIWLDEEPNQPIIVVGLNERVDPSGKLLPEYPAPNVELPPCDIDPDNCGGGGGGTPLPPREAPHSLRMWSNLVYDDAEHWTRGNAEIHYMARPYVWDLTQSSRNYLASADRGTRDPWHYENSNIVLGTWDDQSGQHDEGVMYWWEEDGGDIDTRYVQIGAYPAISYLAQDSRDLMGGKVHHWTDSRRSHIYSSFHEGQNYMKWTLD